MRVHVSVVDNVSVAQYGVDSVAANERQDDREREGSIFGARCSFADQFDSVEDQIDFGVISSATKSERFIFVVAVKMEGVNSADGNLEDASGWIQSVADVQSDTVVIDYAASLTKRLRATSVEKDTD